MTTKIIIQKNPTFWTRICDYGLGLDMTKKFRFKFLGRISSSSSSSSSSRRILFLVNIYIYNS
jgi:hypothetical protein